MKKIFLIIFLLVNIKCYSQKWHLSKIDKSNKYKYEYLAQLDKEANNIFGFEPRLGINPSEISVINEDGKPFPFPAISIKNLANDSTVIIVGDSTGKAFIQLNGGQYYVEISALGQHKFFTTFKFQTGYYGYLIVQLVPTVEKEIYQINSRKKLREDEIVNILNCIKNNRNEVHKKDCSCQEKYLVSTHI